MANGFGAVDEQAHGGEGKTLPVSPADAARAVVVSEIGQPTQRSLVFVNGAKQKSGMTNPVKGRHKDERYALHER